MSEEQKVRIQYNKNLTKASEAYASGAAKAESDFSMGLLQDIQGQGKDSLRSAIKQELFARMSKEETKGKTAGDITNIEDVSIEFEENPTTIGKKSLIQDNVTTTKTPRTSGSLTAMNIYTELKNKREEELLDTIDELRKTISRLETEISGMKKAEEMHKSDDERSMKKRCHWARAQTIRSQPGSLLHNTRSTLLYTIRTMSRLKML